VRVQNEEVLRKAHANDPHCRAVMDSGEAAGKAARGDQRKMDEAYREFYSVVATEPQNHDAHTYYEAFKCGWHGE